MRQIGNRLCPEPWVGASAAAAPQGFRFPVWEFNWPGAYRLEDGRPAALVRREPPVVAAIEPLSADLSPRLPGDGRNAGAVCRARGVHPDVAGRSAGRRARHDVVADRQTAAVADRDDRVHPVDRHRHELLGDDVVDGARARADGRPLSVLRGLAGDDRRVPDRQRHVVEHAVRPAAGDDGANLRVWIRC